MSAKVTCFLLFSLMETRPEDFFARVALTQIILMVVWLGLSILVASAAAKKGRSAAWFFVGSLILSPVLMCVNNGNVNRVNER